MTRKDVIQTELNFLNIVIGNVTLGALIGLSIYNIQSSGINAIYVIVAIIIFSAIAKFLSWQYEKLLDELKVLP